MHVSSLITSHFKREKLLCCLSVIGIASAIATIYTFNMFESYYTSAVTDLYPSSDNMLIVTESGIPFYQVVPFGSRINQSLIPSINSITGVAGSFPALFLRATDVEDPESFTDTIMGVPIASIGPFTPLVSEALLLDGRLPSPGLLEVCVGIEVGGGGLVIGNTFIIDALEYTVVGLLKPSSILFDHIIIADMPLIQFQFNYQNVITCLFVSVFSPSDVPSVQQLIRGIDPTLQVVTPDDIKQLSSGLVTATTIADLFFGGFITIISILFTILLTVKKYQNQEEEIQILWEMGTPLNRISMVYGLESAVISICGFALGILSGFLLFFGNMYSKTNLHPYFATILEVSIQSIDPEFLLQLFAFSFIYTIISLLYLVSKFIKIRKRVVSMKMIKAREGL